ncbi:MAG: thioredoxin family protein [Kiritimatiellae bacterium]|nr:thioredoxin family protein [Kiritimatiellia bacterium]
MSANRWAVVVCAALAVAAQGATGWEDDFEKAIERAQKENKYVLVDFSGSDWCGWCIKLDEEVFSKKAFKDYANENLVLVLLDFPRRKELPKKTREQNEALLKKFGVRGFPTVLILNPKGEEVARTGYKPGGAEAYVEHLKELIGKAKAAQK